MDTKTKTFLIIPKIAYTFYAKMSKMMQNSINVSSGETSMAQSGTPRNAPRKLDQ